nr:MAG TPA: protein of unknown function (DUF4352) [Caudoviricetes sp.]
MSTFLVIIGFLGFFVCLICLIINLIRRKPKKLCGILLAVFFACFVVGVVTLEPADPPEQSPVSDTEASETTAEPETMWSTTVAPESTPAPETSVTPEAETESIAVSQNLGNWIITVSGSTFEDEVSQSLLTSFQPDDGNKYLLVSLSVTNNGTQAAVFLPLFAMSGDISTAVYYNTDYEYKTTNLIGYDKNAINETLNPLTTKDCAIAFEVPAAIEKDDNPLVLRFSENGNTVEFDLR